MKNNLKVRAVICVERSIIIIMFIKFMSDPKEMKIIG